MTRWAAVPGVLLRQLANVKELLSGRAVTILSLGSATLERDDVVLARKWLRNRSAWFDASVVRRYETDFARWNGSRHAFATMGGRVALSAAIEALGLKPGDEVILPAYTCVVVPNAFHFAGVDIEYADIELETYGLDASRLEIHITQRTRAIVLHHLYGLVCRDYEVLLDLARKHGLYVIEDCAHATGAEYKGRKVGNYGDVAFYSSEQSKVFNTIQGGLVVTNDDSLGERLGKILENAPYPDEEWIDKQLHNVFLNYYQLKHSQRWWLADIGELLFGGKRLLATTEEELGGICPAHYGRRMPAPIASLGSNQLNKIDRYNKLRRLGALRWDRWCEGHGYDKPLVIEGSVPVFLRYPVLVEAEKKEDLAWAVKDLRVELGVWFQGSLHPVSGVIPDCPNAAEAVRRCVNFQTVLY